MEKIALITGASRGMGRSLALELARRFDKLILTATSLTSFDAELRDTLGRKGSYFAVDFSNPASADEFCDALTLEVDTLSLLVNNAGVYADVPAGESGVEFIQRMTNVNFVVPALLLNRLLPLLRKGQPALILNMSSIQAVLPTVGHTTYAATKAALSTFSRVLRQELSGTGIQVTTLEPTGVNTWNDPCPESLLSPEDIASVIGSLVDLSARVQIEEVILSNRN